MHVSSSHKPQALCGPFLQAYMASNQHRRALQLLRTSGNGTLLENPQFKHLAACCLVECKEWEECLVLLGDDIDSPSDLSADYVR